MTAARPVVLVTGATAGLGQRLAETLASDGFLVLLHGRDHRKVHALADRLGGQGLAVEPHVADLSSLREVATLAEHVTARHPRLDVLINNAGVGPGSEGAVRELSRDGHELRFAVDYLAPYLLTRSLLPLLCAAAPARVVNVGSAAQLDIDFDDLTMTRLYHGWVAYGRAKLALASFTMDLAEELEPRQVTANCLHPASFMDTPMVREIGTPPRSTVQEGADAVLRLVCGEATADVTGQYFDGTTPADPHEAVTDPARRRALRKVTEELLRDHSGLLGPLV
ncbi:SDR family NAD(P)-dependent oxidoreductase [Streptomyces sp. CRN 30]|uniref:SDR family NAD(P)-dependent oxidoreductase n=1 Tax=Streptomyces sp. CRN 30 TaxID=3075613 RepID=UPI002A82405A|nr:SDR family NAD(P)-dependent oxidoreductase [Streptomyces sp. CRN 30]